MAQSFPPPSDTSSKVELSVSCSSLKNLDYFSKSDPTVFLYTRGREAGWVKVGRTEVIDNNLNPKFSTTFRLEYRFEEIQNLQFAVYDVDDKHHVDNIDKQQLLGTMECTLAEIMAAGVHLTKSLKLQGKPAGIITIHSEEVRNSNFIVDFQLSATKLDKKDVFGKSDPYIEIAKVQEGGEFTLVYRSQPIMKTLSPKWPAFEMDFQKLCSGDWERTLQFSVWDWDKSGNNELIGLVTTSLKNICPESGGKVLEMELTNPSHKGKKKSSGVLMFNSALRAVQNTSFVDYIKGGCQISLITAVDFTGSNGAPSDPNSLHYINPVKDNEYVQAIKSIASVLAPYDSDQMIPSFGFGAQIPPHFHVSHCFPLDLNTQNPEVYGVQGILNAYQHAVRTVKLYGPTNFSSILDKAMQFASVRENQQSQSYFILLVITDGEITDMADTVDRIVAASKLPLSIVIVGVGGADFKNMEILDADDTPLRSRNGHTMARDIVQFVPFRELMRKAGPNGCVAKETLAEIPGQLMAFMKSNNIKPNPPVLRRSETTEQLGPQPYPSGPQGPAPYPSGPQGHAPYPSGPQGPAPYPSGSQGPAPYPRGPQGPAPYPSGPQGPAFYPGGPQGPAFYPGGPQGPAPYPSGPQGPAPYPSGLQGPAPYPSGPQGPAPYPRGPQGPAPYPSGPQGPASYPSGPQAPAPYPSGPQGSAAPYPSGPQGPAPYPSGPQGPAPYPSGPQGLASYPSGPQGPVSYPSGPQGPASYPSGPQGPAPYPSGHQGPAPYPSGPQGPAAPYPSGPQGPAAPYPSGPQGPASYPSGPQGVPNLSAPQGVPNLSAPQGSVPNSSAPQGVPNPISPQGSVPNPSAPQGSVPNPSALQGVPNPSAPQGSVPNPSAPQGSVPNPSAPQGSVPNPSAPQGTVSNPSSPQGSDLNPSTP